MPTAAATLNALHADLGRLLAAGPGHAAADEKFRGHVRDLSDLAGQVPALRPLAEAAERVAAPAGANASSFPDLLLRLGVVRAALAEAGVPGEIAPIPSAGPWPEPFGISHVHWTLELLGRPAAEAVERLATLERGAADLRLLGPLLECLRSASLGEMVAERLLPQLGPAVVPELLAGFDPAGRGDDARRLTAICRIDRETGRELCFASLREGSVEVQLRALRHLPELAAPAEVEPVALPFAESFDPWQRAAALTALGVCDGDAVLAALLRGCDDAEGDVRAAALGSLIKLRHPRTAPAIIERLNALVSRREVPGGRPTASPDTIIEVLLEALGARPERDRAAAVLPSLLAWPHAPFRRRAIVLLCAAGPVTPEIIPALVRALFDSDWQLAASAAEALGRFGSVAAEEAAGPLRSLLVREETLPVLRPALLSALGQVAGTDPRTQRTLLEYLGGGDEALRAAALRGLASIGPAAKPALPRMLAFLRITPWEPDLFCAIDPDGRAVSEALRPFLRNPDAEAFAVYARLIAAYGPKLATLAPELIRLTRSGDAQLRALAAEALRAVRAS